jgi:hypothetical protein
VTVCAAVGVAERDDFFFPSITHVNPVNFVERLIATYNTPRIPDRPFGEPNPVATGSSFAS